MSKRDQNSTEKQYLARLNTVKFVRARVLEQPGNLPRSRHFFPLFALPLPSSTKCQARSCCSDRKPPGELVSSIGTQWWRFSNAPCDAREAKEIRRGRNAAASIHIAASCWSRRPDLGWIKIGNAIYKLRRSRRWKVYPL